ncbi:hypothetical protein M2396_000295 [Pseudomonas sp. BIGb0278]|uniref:hypothetical protein n=1 Tax=Pseudomonas sp. BIGb0278 TaxID=2940607 RepID=UPI002167D088|nr:hypothetical protein [Pseudomonas sp. BIGb0278]MCS4282030.1 hypothetical protein [Pseudomonas sp. BIGb0278]
MNEELQKIGVLAEELEKLADSFRNLLADTKVHKDLRVAFESLFANLNSLASAFTSNDIDAITNSANTAAIYGEAIGHQSLKLNSTDFHEAGQKIMTKAVELRRAVEQSPLNLDTLKKSELRPSFKRFTLFPSSIDSADASRLKVMIEEQEKHDQRVKKLLNENELRITSLAKRLQELEGAAQGEIDKISSAYSDGLREIGVKKTEIDGILGHVSGRAIAGDYEKSAAEEKKMADRLRFWSLVCMAVIAGCLVYTLVGHSTDWQQSLFRISLTFLLSVPAAYLARESAKHREQQYQHLQTSLDLKALSPFVASLPDEEQHKIKIAIASKIFAGRDFSKVGADPFPINTQEIIMELLKKVHVSKAKPQKASE